MNACPSFAPGHRALWLYPLQRVQRSPLIRHLLRATLLEAVEAAVGKETLPRPSGAAKPAHRCAVCRVGMSAGKEKAGMCEGT